MEYQTLKEVPGIKSGCVVMKREQHEENITFSYFATSKKTANQLVQYSWTDWDGENSERFTIIETIQHGWERKYDPNGADYDDPNYVEPW